MICGLNHCADGARTAFPGNDRMRKICADQEEISSRPDLLLYEYRFYRPQYHAFFSETDFGSTCPCRSEISVIVL
jgi:hypothetical protein